MGTAHKEVAGPRVVESLEILAEIFHPELFPSRYEGKGWMRYAAEPREG
jgi:iron complex transport system substrate-binding protein